MTSQNSDAFASAIASGDTLTVESLIKSNPELINHPEWTPPPLHCAILWNQPEILRILLENNADIEMLDPGRKTTPLRYAIMYCKTNLIPILLEAGANAGSINGKTAMELAVHAANGAYSQFDDLPRPAEYKTVIDVLNQHGIEQ